MLKKSVGDKSTRKLTKLGGKSIGLTLPIELVRELGWREKQKVTVTRVRGGVMIKDWKK
ncbi:MAG: AbrB/MazE/SpoVT family DNA-binding domain-containing protein [Candidatus Moraniibacteriota bacterium]